MCVHVCGSCVYQTMKFTQSKYKDQLVLHNMKLVSKRGIFMK